MDYETANFIVLIINTFMCLSSPLNLAVYCGMSSQFREQFTKIVTSRCSTPDPMGGAVVSVHLTLAQIQPRPASRETRAVSPQCPYLAGNKKLCRRETSV